MTVHLLKMSVGTESVEGLAVWQDLRRREKAKAGQEAVAIHWTRNRPRRGDEVLDGGSIYWVIKGRIRARQRIIRLDEGVNEAGKRMCGLVLDDELVRTELKPSRPMQGWRYLDPDAAPADLGGDGEAGQDLPEDMREELRALGLL
ncbi:MAG: DUF1489 domain-containing protein [Rhodospirillaceae bacterium]|nr:DUF1489 domain-containing protein [Rhodospirillaceae bacterium]MBT6137505.1 DUF1489 domain-containing protein [Rhodospirillaceae bacterium]